MPTSSQDPIYKEARQAFLVGYDRSVPKLRQADHCIGCRKCAEICPAHAIVMKQKKPVIDRKKCIRCFCCQEFCPKGALEARRSPIARLLLREKPERKDTHA